MTIENTDPVDVVDTNPFTYEVLDFGAQIEELVVELEAIDSGIAHARRYRQAITDELARRADRLNTRKLELEDGRTIEVNAPSSDSYMLDVLKAELEALVEADVIDAGLLGNVIKQGEPKVPPPVVDKREVNKLKKHVDGRVLAAIAKARTIKNNTRTAKLAGEAKA